MNEEELKATIGETAFNAMSAEQRTALLDKYSKAKGDDDKSKDKDKDKGGKKGAKDKEEEDDSDEDDEDDLRSKARKEKEKDANSKEETKRLEKQLAFNMGVEQFVKDNTDLLPNEVQEILTAAKKETYDTATDKANAIRSAVIQSFFSVQENLDLLTKTQKAMLDDFLKLTKNGKEAKSEAIYENLFEPALETLRKIKKAEELNRGRSGFAPGSKMEDGYRDRLMKNSKKTYLGEKGDK